jgi:hypothetical protein
VRHSDASTFGPILDEVNHGIASIMGDPGRFQSSPRSFFN